MQNQPKKIASTLLAAMMVFALLAVVPQAAIAAGEVCEIVGGAKYTSLGDALDAIPTGGDETIKLLENITHNDSIMLIDKSLILDLNGKTLDVVAPYGMALAVNSGRLVLLDPNDGAFNVMGEYGVWVENGGKAEVTNATAADRGYHYSYGVYADGPGSEVRVCGNVTVDTSDSSNHGVVVFNGGKVTIDGNITVPIGAGYIWFRNGSADTHKTKSEFEAATTKVGYYTYTDGTTSTVWARINNCEIVQTGRLFNDVGEAVEAAKNGQTIKLLDDITYADGLVVSGKSITFDLNGKKLDVVTPWAHAGLYVEESGEVKLLNPTNGEFNVTGVWVGVQASGGKAEVTSAKATASSGSSGVSAQGGSEVTVYGDVTVNVGGSSNFGVSNYESTVTVNGDILVPAGAVYIAVNGVKKAKAEFATATTKAGYHTYAEGAAVTWVRAKPCEIVETGRGYSNVQDAVNAVPTGEERTVRLLEHMTHNSSLNVDGRIITFDLNGKTLNVVNASSQGLYVFNNGQVKLLDPEDGAFNVTGKTFGVYVFNGKAEVTNARATGDSYSRGIDVSGSSSEVIVYGNVKVDVGASTNIGVSLFGYETVIVNGVIDVPPGAGYILIGLTPKSPSEHEIASSKPNYLEYTDGTTQVVWVRDPATYVAPTLDGPAAMTLTTGYAATSTGTYTATGLPVPSVSKTSGDAAITWNGLTNRLDIAAGLGAGSYPVVLTASNGATPDASITFTLTVVAPTYELTVNYGTGSGSYTAGATVNITADAAPSGKVFDTWTASGLTLSSPGSASTSFAMPPNAVTITANFVGRRGDANVDGIVNAADAAEILRHLVRLTELTTQGLLNAKVTDGSGPVSAADAAKILRYLVRLELTL